MQAWYNGKFMDWQDIKVSPLSHAFSRGVSIFEVVTIVDTDRGPAFVCFDAHLDRFINSSKLMLMDLPLTRQELAEVVLESARVNKVRNGISKYNAFYAEEALLPLPAKDVASLFVFSDTNENFGFVPPTRATTKTMAISRYKKLHQATVPIQAKVTGNYVQAYLSAREMKQRGFDLPLFLDTEDHVCEGPTNSAFFVKDGKVITSGLNRVLAGTTRLAVIDLARHIGLEVVERDISVSELDGMQELFVCGSTNKITPVRQLEDRKLGAQCPGPVTSKIMDALDELYIGKGDLAEKWLTWVD